MRIFENEVGRPHDERILDDLAYQYHKKKSAYHFHERDIYKEMKSIAENNNQPRLAKLYRNLSQRHHYSGREHNGASIGYLTAPFLPRDEVYSDFYKGNANKAHKSSSETRLRENKVMDAIKKRGMFHIHEKIREQAKNNLKINKERGDV